MKILLVPGDGIGPEVMKQAVKLISLLQSKYGINFQLTRADWGAERWLKEKVGLPKGAIETIPYEFDAILFGALGDPRIPDMAHGREILLGLRFGLDLYINLRPVTLWHESFCPLKGIMKNDIDMVIFRENTEDLYLGLGRVEEEGSPDERTIDESFHSKNGVSRIIQAAFDYAKKNNRERVTLVDKSNAIKYGGKLWQKEFYHQAEMFPGIKCDHLFVDVAAMQMVLNPKRFDVIVTSNLFGDILSDLGAGLVGGLGLAASANINPAKIALFEPVHGSAPDLANKDLANPMAMFLSVAMMMRYFAYGDIAIDIENSVVSALKKGFVTRDLGGHLSCTKAADEILGILSSN